MLYAVVYAVVVFVCTLFTFYVGYFTGKKRGYKQIQTKTTKH